MASKQPSDLRQSSHSIASCSACESFQEHSTGRTIKHYIPPGALSSYSQAQRCLVLCGLKEGSAPQTRLSLGRRRRQISQYSSKCLAKQEQPSFPCKTIDTLFSHRRHRIALQAHCAAFKQQLRKQNEHSGLLNLPDELLVKVICNLRHDETSPIAKVCRQMQGLVKEAIQQHFDFATPAVHPAADEPNTPRLLKRHKMADCESEASSAVQPRLQPARALKFQSTALKRKASDEGLKQARTSPA